MQIEHYKMKLMLLQLLMVAASRATAILPPYVLTYGTASHAARQWMCY
jgi:hypothetical protein